MFNFYTLRKRYERPGFRTFSGGMEMQHWREMHKVEFEQEMRVS